MTEHGVLHIDDALGADYAAELRDVAEQTATLLQRRLSVAEGCVVGHATSVALPTH